MPSPLPMKLRASVPIEAGERPGLHQMALGKVGRLVGRQVRFARQVTREIPHGSHLLHSNRLKQEQLLPEDQRNHLK